MEWLAQFLREFWCLPACRDRTEMLSIIGCQYALCSPTKAVSLFQDRVEHRGEVARRRIDDLQELGGRGLLLQGFARLGDQPRVLHRNDRLCGEVLQQHDLLVGEWSDLAAVNID